MEVTNNRPIRYYNMDVVRYYLAVCVILSHLNSLTGLDIWWPTPGNIRVGAFFTISGFLVYPSFFRKNDLSKYFKTRAYRILPPYFTVIIVFSLLLVFVSSLTPGQYFFSWDYWKYLLCNLSFMNFLDPDLPGVFQGEQFKMSAVNGSLWTMKIEWLMYLSVPLVAWIHRKHQQKFYTIFTIILAFSIAYRIFFHQMYESTGNELYHILDRQFFGQTSYFYSGAFIYFHKEQFLKYKWQILAASFALWAVGGYIPLYEVTLKPFVVSAVVIWFCIVGDWGKHISRHDNVSYDLYLYHFPIIQLGILFGLKEWPLPAILLYVFGVTTLCAIASWNLIGRHFKRLAKFTTTNKPAANG